jgi:predicted O-linked N-acetylglucosamine transferase (SPINDLY family)
MLFSISYLFKGGRQEPQQLVDRGIAAGEAGRTDEALRCYRRAIEVDPNHVAAHFNLGLLHLAGARYQEAEAEFHAALRLRDGFPEAWVALAESLEEQGKDDEAVDALNQAIAQRVDYIGALMNASVLLQKMDRLDAAELSYRRVIALDPASPVAHNNLGNVLHTLGRSAEAEACFRACLQIAPESAVAHSNLASVLRDLGRFAGAEASCREALRLDPRLPEAHHHLGSILQMIGQASGSEASLRQALALRPDYREAHNSLGNSLRDLGRLDEAEASFLSALALDPDDSAARDNFLLTLNYTSRYSRDQVYDQHREWARRHEAPRASARKHHANPRDPRRRLRIGYVSPDFRRHSVAYFIEPVLAQHDRNGFEVYCYSNVARPDQMTDRLLKLADHAGSIVGINDETAAETVHKDGIDILVDLAGHTAGHRLELFALKPAPVQATYLGYPNTTGLESIDWRITDAYADPPEDGDAFHSEHLARLPKSFLCFQPPREAPEVGPPPFRTNGYITFGSFNVLPKMTPEVIRTWSQLLGRVPRSRLLLKALGLGDAPSRGRVLAEFGRHGIAAARVTALPMEGALQDHLARYHDMDIALDPFPFNGTTTTLEALWMGVPVIALEGDRHSSRVGASILANAGLGELLARNIEAYIETAARLAADGDRLAQLRRTTRNRISASPLLDPAGFMRALEDAYRRMWEDWCDASENPVEP